MKNTHQDPSYKKLPCNHCQQLFPISKLFCTQVQGKTVYFCCKGCEGVYRFIMDSKLGDFYSFLGNNELKPPSQKNLDYQRFDSKGFLDNYLSKNAQGFIEARFMIKGIFCSACIELIERALAELTGILEVSINHTNYKLKLTFDEQKLRLSNIVRVIEKLGYEIIPYNPNIHENQNYLKNKQYFFSLVVGIFCTMNIMWVAVAQYAGYFSDSSVQIKDALNLAGFLLSTPVLFYTGRFFFKNAYFQIKNSRIGMDTLVITGASLTYLFSIYAALSKSSETYFESVAMIICFVFSGKYLQERAKKQAGDEIDSLQTLLPKEALCLENGKRILKPLENILVGEILEIEPFGIIPIDGCLEDEKGEVDLQNITGEPLPVVLNKGENILSGSFNQACVIHIKTTKTFSQSLLFSLINTLDSSLSQKPKISTLAANLSTKFSPLVLLLAVLGGVWWKVILGASLSKSLMIAISVIVISCPCALALATPIACLVGVTQAYKNQIIFKKSIFLESLAKAKYIFLDKTGTLTQGILRVSKHKVLAPYEENILLELLEDSHHPISRGIKNHLKQTSHLPLPQNSLKSKKQIPGKGIYGVGEGFSVYGGSFYFLEEEGFSIPKSIKDEVYDADNSYGVFALGIYKEDCKKHSLHAVFLLEDSLKIGIKSFIQNLKKQNKELILLSGDMQKNVQKISWELGIPLYYYEKLPDEKAKIITEFSSKLNKDQTLIMVGDGINDSLALSRSNVGISFLSKQNLSIQNSDVVLLDNKISTLSKSFEISNITYQIIKQNLFFSILYNAIMIPLALSGLILPLFAALSMSLSSLFVVLNSLRIQSKIPSHPLKDE